MKLPIRLRFMRKLFKRDYPKVSLSDYIQFPEVMSYNWTHPIYVLPDAKYPVALTSNKGRSWWWIGVALYNFGPGPLDYWLTQVYFYFDPKPGVVLNEGDTFTATEIANITRDRRNHKKWYQVLGVGGDKTRVYLLDDLGEDMVDISMTADIVNPRFGVLGSQAKTNGNQYFFEFALNCEDDGTVKGSSGAPGSLVFDTPPIIGKAYRDINPDNRLVLSFDSGGFYTLDLGNSTSVSQTGRNLLRQFDRAVVEAVCSDILLGDTTGLLTDSEKVWNTAFLEDTRDSSDPSTKDEWMYDLIMQEYNNVHPRVSADANGVKSMIDMASGSLSITSLNVLRRLRFRTTSNYRARLEYFFTFGLTTLKSENLNGSSALLSDYSKNWPLDQITESNFPINIGMDDQPIFVNLVTEVKDWGNILCPPSSHGQVSTDAYLYPIPYVFQRTSDSGLRTVFTNTSGTFGGEHVPYGHLEMIDEVYNSKSQYVGPQVLEDHYPLP
jgi:hypothetical protein